MNDSGGNSMNLKSMSIEKLVKLKDQIESALSSKIAETRRTLESNLANLSRLGSHSMRGRGGTTRGKVAPKYRNPDNPSETWAGRGLKPRWLTAALKAGRKLESFSIGAKGEKAPKKKPKPKAKVARKAMTKKARRPRAPARPRPAPSSSPPAAAQA
jgi:DNA-binding protein H-NS